MLKEIGKRVKMARNARQMSQMQLADALRISVPYLSHIEQGKQAMSITMLYGICETLEVSADWILRNSSPESQKIADAELAELLKDCTPAEKTAMLKVLESMKEAFHGIRDKTV